MRIAVVCPVGHLDRHGYQHVYRDCVASMAAFAERVYLVQSVRGSAGTGELLAAHPNVRLISDERTWFARRPDGAEWFDAHKVLENANVGAAAARADGMDCAVCLFVNNYVPESAAVALADKCRWLRENVKPWDWLYRKDQLGGVLFRASVRMPFVVNLSALGRLRFAADSLAVGSEIHTMERGDFGEMDGEAVVDVQLEMTLADLEAKMNFIRCYHDLVPKRRPFFDWGYWRAYYIDKFRQKTRSDEPLDAIGRRLAAASRADFVSHEILGAL
jgi:hypothetical protein